ncbi:MAG: histidine phosphatase family protein [Gammaproteobacteria bacterium]|nr:histidine phosphatase family protein [Gammaproteobacteria bacterium]
MKRLTLVRHAKSSWSDVTLGDRQRPLNKRGKRDAPIMGRRIMDHGIRPSLIISSPAERAWRTAKIIAAEISYPREFLQREDSLYLASLDDFLDVLVAQDSGFNSIMIVGHNPGITDFANFLSPGLTGNLPTAGVVSVELDQDHWNLYERPKARLLVHDYPKKTG